MTMMNSNIRKHTSGMPRKVFLNQWWKHFHQRLADLCHEQDTLERRWKCYRRKGLPCPESLIERLDALFSEKVYVIMYLDEINERLSEDRSCWEDEDEDETES